MAAQQKGQQPQVAAVEPVVAYQATPEVVGSPVGTVIGGLLFIFGTIMGIVAGGFVWVELSKRIPQGVTVIEKVGRYALISGASIAVQRTVSEAIIADYEDLGMAGAKALEHVRAQKSLPAAVQQVQQ